MEKTVLEYLDMMGFAFKDKITNFEGSATSVSFDIAGCVQVTLSPQVKKSGELDASVWVDAKRLIKVGRKRVMVPHYVDPYETLDLLGFSCKDKVSGFAGTLTSVCFLITGRTECILAPPVSKDGELHHAWFEVERLEKVGKIRAMPKPDFVVVDGPEPKPARLITRSI